jgi:hypothetical protein
MPTQSSSDNSSRSTALIIRLAGFRRFRTFHAVPLVENPTTYRLNTALGASAAMAAGGAPPVAFSVQPDNSSTRQRTIRPYRLRTSLWCPAAMAAGGAPANGFPCPTGQLFNPSANNSPPSSVNFPLVPSGNGCRWSPARVERQDQHLHLSGSNLDNSSTAGEQFTTFV